MNIEELTIKEAKEIASTFADMTCKRAMTNDMTGEWKHPMLGRRVIVRTYSAGVHIGTLAEVNPNNAMECKLTDALRLWKWNGGGLSLSAVANNGIKGGRLNRTGEIVLTNAIEYIQTTEKAEKTYVKFIED